MEFSHLLSSPRVSWTPPFTFVPSSQPPPSLFKYFYELEHVAGNQFKRPRNRLYICYIQCLYTDIQIKVLKYCSKLWIYKSKTKIQVSVFKNIVIYTDVLIVYDLYTKIRNGPKAPKNSGNFIWKLNQSPSDIVQPLQQCRTDKWGQSPRSERPKSSSLTLSI